MKAQNRSLKATMLAAATCLPTLFAASPALATEPFIGEIRSFGFNFCPRGWASADGQELAISQNTALFSLLGTMYGGDGRTTFALPDLRGRFAMHQGTGPGLSSREVGSRGGSERVALTQAEMPEHTHDVLITNTDQSGNSGGLVVQQVADAGMASGGIASGGGSQPHTNMPPYTVVNTCVALQGVFPSRN